MSTEASVGRSPLQSAEHSPRRARRNRRRPAGIRERLPSWETTRERLRRFGRWLGPLALAVALIAVVGGGVALAHHWVTDSSRFWLERIEVTGVTELSADDVRRQTGIELGTNLFELDLAGIEATLEEHPWISSARAHRRLPDGLLLEVEEETATAVVQLEGLYLVDENGRAFKRTIAGSAEAAGLPIVTGIDRSDYLDRPENTRARVKHAVSITERYRSASHRPSVGEVHIDSRHGISLYTYETAVAIHLGRGELREIDQRIRVFDTAWASLSAQERLLARAVHVDRHERPDRVTIAFARAE